MDRVGAVAVVLCGGAEAAAGIPHQNRPGAVVVTRRADQGMVCRRLQLHDRHRCCASTSRNPERHATPCVPLCSNDVVSTSAHAGSDTCPCRSSRPNNHLGTHSGTSTGTGLGTVIAVSLVHQTLTVNLEQVLKTERSHGGTMRIMEMSEEVFFNRGACKGLFFFVMAISSCITTGHGDTGIVSEAAYKSHASMNQRTREPWRPFGFPTSQSSGEKKWRE